MGKRSSFERRERDFYPTPPEAVLPLIPHIYTKSHFAEPCYGKGDLSRALQSHGLLENWISDIEGGTDACSLNETHVSACDIIITNPPWPQSMGEPTVSIAKHLSDLKPTWLLLSSDFAHNKYFQKLERRCRKIVAVGRVSWMQNGTAGKDNCAWYLFDKHYNGQPRFYGRS